MNVDTAHAIYDRLRRAAAAREARVSELVRDAVRELLDRVEQFERREPAPTANNAETVHNAARSASMPCDVRERQASE